MRRVMFLIVPMMMLLMTGCVTARNYQLTTDYSDKDFAPWQGSGTAFLTGQAFMKTVGGDVKTCAGQEVFLMPGTAYNQEIMGQILRPGSVKFSNRSPEADKYSRSSVCDAQGNFAFADLPALKWYVIVDVTWGVPTQYGINSQGGMLTKFIALIDGANKVILTGQNLAH